MRQRSTMKSYNLDEDENEEECPSDSGRKMSDLKGIMKRTGTGSEGATRRMRKHYPAQEKRIQTGIVRSYGNLLTPAEYDEANNSISKKTKFLIK